jgi:hypothetical protein
MVVLVCLGLACNRRGATLLGFGAGLCSGAILGANTTLLVLSRCLAGFVLGSFNTLEVETNWMLAAVLATLLSAIAGLLLVFLGIHHGPLVPYLAGTLGSALYNGAVAAPVYAIAKILNPGTRRLMS